jgi:hypothetical protein
MRYLSCSRLLEPNLAITFRSGSDLIFKPNGWARLRHAFFCFGLFCVWTEARLDPSFALVYVDPYYYFLDTLYPNGKKNKNSFSEKARNIVMNKFSHFGKN